MVGEFKGLLIGVYKPATISPDLRRVPVSLVGSGVFSIGDGAVLGVSATELQKFRMTLWVPQIHLDDEYTQLMALVRRRVLVVVDHKYIDKTITRGDRQVVVNEWSDTVLNYMCTE